MLAIAANTSRRPLRGAKARGIFIATMTWGLVGVVTNVGLAWGLMFWKTQSPMEYVRRSDATGTQVWLHRTPEAWSEVGGTWRAVDWDRTETQQQGSLYLEPTQKEDGRHVAVVMTDFRVGVPFRSLCAWGCTESTRTPKELHSRHGLLAFDVPGLGSFVRPTIPLWPGFALNSVFYAALAWGLWQIPLAVRRRLRLSAGKCPRCGYSLAGLADDSPCPECGSATSRSRRRTSPP